MFPQRCQAVRLIMTSRLVLMISIFAVSVPLFGQQEIPRSIISDDFVKNRPRSKSGTRKQSSSYRLASTPRRRLAKEAASELLQVGLTIWRVQADIDSAIYQSSSENRRQLERLSKRVEADTKFREGDLLRLSIESPRKGYLYVINRDSFTDGGTGETNLIFPVHGEDNRLEPGKLIDIPTQHEPPFKATPKPNQAGELLTIMVTRWPLQLPLSKNPLPITSSQLMHWEQRWSSLTDRYEMNDGAGQARTIEERQASPTEGTRQLTRNDPAPQTIYYLRPKNSDGLLFNLMLSYVR